MMTADSASKYFDLTEKQVKSIDRWILQRLAGKDQDIENGIPQISKKLKLSHAETRILLQNRLNVAKCFRMIKRVLMVMIFIAFSVVIWRFIK